jgi:hypothetical protein
MTSFCSSHGSLAAAAAAAALACVLQVGGVFAGKAALWLCSYSKASCCVVKT